ncbi:hypothetical protein DSO57_1027341 [Entomophthora muscae]|uniref:Uncharacterized protein n=2 Tax=Entomophthora muscae TaxID=34485 RepID=A0ACC2U065_9FUNG|nr:hypothetical protein DSO57_1027341 [Entomophthora muscae]
MNNKNMDDYPASENSFFGSLDDSVLLGELNDSTSFTASSVCNANDFDSHEIFTSEVACEGPAFCSSTNNFSGNVYSDESFQEEPRGRDSRPRSILDFSLSDSIYERPLSQINLSASSQTAPVRDVNFGHSKIASPLSMLEASETKGFVTRSLAFSNNRVNDWVFSNAEGSLEKKEDSVTPTPKWHFEEFSNTKNISNPLKPACLDNTSMTPEHRRTPTCNSSSQHAVPLTGRSDSSAPAASNKPKANRNSHKLPSLPYRNYAEYLKSQCAISKQVEVVNSTIPAESMSQKVCTGIPKQTQKAANPNRLTPPFVFVHKPIVSSGSIPCASCPTKNPLSQLGIHSKISCKASHNGLSEKQHRTGYGVPQSLVQDNQSLHPITLATKKTLARNRNPSNASTEELPSSERILTDSLIMRLDHDSSYCWERKLVSGDHSRLSTSSYLSKQKSNSSLKPVMATSDGSLLHEHDTPSLVNSSSRRTSPCISGHAFASCGADSVFPNGVPALGPTQDEYSALEKCALLLERIHEKLLPNSLSRRSSMSLDSLLDQLQAVQQILKTQKDITRPIGSRVDIATHLKMQKADFPELNSRKTPKELYF